MRYYVTLDPTPGAEPILVDVTELPTGELDVSLGGKKVDVDVVSLSGSGGPLSIRVGGRMVDLTTEGQPPELGAVASGHRSYVRVESERQRAAAAAKKAGGGAGEKTIKSPMPGRVVRLLVALDADVAAGQTLCVIEAMKMENEVKAKADCKVAQIHVAEGATVEANGKLFTLA
jgi:glutaconyl-CoA/methylmalonyl-CoA decarboxylase subunit gamma